MNRNSNELFAPLHAVALTFLSFDVSLCKKQINPILTVDSHVHRLTVPSEKMDSSTKFNQHTLFIIYHALGSLNQNHL